MTKLEKTVQVLNKAGYKVVSTTQGTDEYDPSINLPSGVNISVDPTGGFLVVDGEEGMLVETYADLLEILGGSNG